MLSRYVTDYLQSKFFFVEALALFKVLNINTGLLYFGEGHTQRDFFSVLYSSHKSFTISFADCICLTAAETCPISSSPSSRSPSNIPFFARPRPNTSINSSREAPRVSASCTCL